MSMLTIDGSQGEGGGQVLRSALALSLATGVPFQIIKIRARRSNPGLMRQHLTAVRAATAVGRATVEGAEVRSSTLTFKPTTLEGGEHTFAIGSAGSTMLVLQAVMPAIIHRRLAATLHLEGGTHNSLAPPFDFFAQALVPQLTAMGANIEATISRHGFYPAGGGKLTVSLSQADEPRRLTLLARGEERSKQLRAIVAGLPFNIAQREMAAAAAALGWGPETFRPLMLKQHEGPGNMLFAQLDFANVTELVSRAGERGFSAEKVAEEVANQVKNYLSTDAPVGPFLADQLIVPMALGAGGVFRTGELDAHTHTQIDVVRRFLPAKIAIIDESHGVKRIEIEPR
ncbi:MAG: RNA 3'-terminal phosphate cyclase [Polyangiaceae bacterium]